MSRSKKVKYGASLIEAISGFITIIFVFLTFFFHKMRIRWGARENELKKEYAGDNLVPEPSWGATHAITINAHSSMVWPWIIQIGQGRGGFYSYEKLENIVGSEIYNTNKILNDFQSISVGDGIQLHCEIPPMRVELVESNRILLLVGDPSGGEDGVDLKTTWGFYIEEIDEHSCRLISRTRYKHGPGLKNWLMGGPLFIEPISFVMERKMLSVIKNLVES